MKSRATHRCDISSGESETVSCRERSFFRAKVCAGVTTQLFLLFVNDSRNKINFIVVMPSIRTPPLDSTKSFLSIGRLIVKGSAVRLNNLTNMHMLRLFKIENSQIAELPPV